MRLAAWFRYSAHTCQRHAWTVLLAALVLATASGWYTAGNLGMDTDTSRLFPDDLPWQQVSAEFDAAFPQANDVLLVVIDAGIPAGGLFSGAEGENPVNGQAYDACYHQLCDNIENVSSQAIDEMSDAVAHATMTLAMTEAAVNGTSRGKAGQKGSTTSEYRGNLLQR